MEVKRVALFSATGAVLIAAALAAANALSQWVYLRVDLSSGRIYSLSPATKGFLAKLDDRVLVRAYFSRELPAQYAPNRQYLSSLLREYRNYSRGKVRFQFVDVDSSEEAKSEAYREGVIPVRFNVISREKFEIRDSLMGLVLRYEDKKEVIPVLQDTRGLEYDLTSRIRKLTALAKPSLAFATDGGATGPEALPRDLRESLEHLYELGSLNLKELKGGATQYAALLVLGPQSALEEAALYGLDQFLMSGRPVVVLADTHRVDLQTFFAASLNTALDPLLNHYGLGLRRNITLDPQCQKMSVAQQQGWISITNIIDYPPFVLATDLSDTHPVTRDLDSLTLPFASPLEVSTRTTSAKVEVLARSSKSSWHARQGGFSLNPFQRFEPQGEDPKGPFALAAVVSGSFKSYFPEPPKGASGVHRTSTQGTGRLAVVGTSRFLTPDIPPNDPSRTFLLNLADWAAQSPDLISIRSKGSAGRPLREQSPAAKRVVRYANILGPGLAVILCGVLRWRSRRRDKANKRLLYVTPPPAPPSPLPRLAQV